MKKIGNFADGSLGLGWGPEEFQNGNIAEAKPQGIVFQGWKRYEEAEEEE